MVCWILELEWHKVIQTRILILYRTLNLPLDDHLIILRFGGLELDLDLILYLLDDGRFQFGRMVRISVGLLLALSSDTLHDGKGDIGERGGDIEGREDSLV